jgi:formate--tetrahydrofolate ligase
VRALKSHSGKYKVVAGRPLPEEMLQENPEDVMIGAANLRKQLENIRAHGVEPVVAINAMPSDFASERDAIHELAASMGVKSAVGTHFVDGGRGAAEIAEAVTEVAGKPNNFHHLYPAEARLKEKIEALATKLYGADGVDYSPLASRQLDGYEKNGFGALPICVAKTQYSLSHDPNLKGAPTGFRLPIREVRASVGAGFIYPICGDMRTMPGLARNPAAASIDLDENGDIVGLY